MSIQIDCWSRYSFIHSLNRRKCVLSTFFCLSGWCYFAAVAHVWVGSFMLVFVFSHIIFNDVGSLFPYSLKFPEKSRQNNIRFLYLSQQNTRRTRDHSHLHIYDVCVCVCTFLCEFTESAREVNQVCGWWVWAPGARSTSMHRTAHCARTHMAFRSIIDKSAINLSYINISVQSPTFPPFSVCFNCVSLDIEISIE